MAPDAMLLGLQSGNAALLRLHQNETTGLVDALTVRLVGTCPPSTALASFGFQRRNFEYSPFSSEISDGLAFLGSMLGDSLLIKWKIKRGNQNVEAEDYEGLQRFMKKEELLDWEMAIYETSEASAKVGTTDIVVIIHNRFDLGFLLGLLLHFSCVWSSNTLNSL